MAKTDVNLLFQLPDDMAKQMNEGMEKVKIMKEMLPGFKTLGIDTTQMGKDMETLERQFKVFQRFIKPSAPAIPKGK